MKMLKCVALRDGHAHFFKYGMMANNLLLAVENYALRNVKYCPIEQLRNPDKANVYETSSYSMIKNNV